MFVIFVPVWKDSSGYQQLKKESAFLSKHLVLEQGKHFYTEGTQYRRKASYRVASFDTSIFFYQNAKAKDKWPVSDSILDNLQLAFTKDPNKYDPIVASDSTAAKPSTKDAVPLPVSIPAKQEIPEHKDESIAKAKHANVKQQQQKANLSTKKPGKAGTKRKLFGGKEECKAQLDLLNSLGLTEGGDPNEVSNGKSSNKKLKTGGKRAKGKKRRQKN